MQTTINHFTREELKVLLTEVIEEVLKAKMAPAIPDEKNYLSRREVAAMLRLSLPTMRKYELAGILPARRIGRKIMFIEKDVIASVALINATKHSRRKEI